MKCASWVCCEQRTFIKWALVSHSHRLALGSCIAHVCWHRRSLWRPLDNLYECPKMWLPHPLWETRGFCIAIPVAPYLLLTLDYSNTSVWSAAGFSLTFLLFVLDAVFLPSLTWLHLGIKWCQQLATDHRRTPLGTCINLSHCLHRTLHRSWVETARRGYWSQSV